MSGATSSGRMRSCRVALRVRSLDDPTRHAAEDGIMERSDRPPIELPDQTARFEERRHTKARSRNDGLNGELEPRTPGKPHRRPQTKQCIRLQRLDAPEIDD